MSEISPDVELRVRCLELAVKYGLSDPVMAAQHFLDFVKGDFVKDDSRKSANSWSEETDAQRALARFCRDNGVTPDEITSRRRGESLVAIRDRAIATISDEFPHMTLMQLGQLFRRDHTSIIASLKRSGSYVKGHTLAAPREIA